MKKITYVIAALAGALLLTNCNSQEYLSVSSPDKANDAFVTSSVNEAFKTLAYGYGRYRSTAGGGNYNWNDVSEIEYYPEYNSSNGRIGYLRTDGLKADSKSGQFNNLFSILARSARIASIIAEKQEFKDAVAAGTVNDWTQLYGEAWTMWAYCYFELTRHYGDVPYGIENKVADSYTLISRFTILDNCIAKLKEVEGLMYDLGQGGIQGERMSRTFANQLIGVCNLYSGGYQTIRTDIEGLYGDVKFDTKYTNNGAGCTFSRRQDWQKYYTEAQKYFRLVLNERKGTAKLITADDRSYANNPFQRNFQYIMDMQVSPESIWEVGNVAPNQSERPYSQGRPSDGGNSLAAPCKVFGGIRVNPIFYYTGYEDGDKRWDASCVVTGSDGAGTEKLVSMTSGSKTKGGIAINKWDISKMASPYVTKCRNSGMNYQFFRIPVTMLELAEVDAAIGDNTEALDLVNRLRNRAGLANLSGLSGENLIKAVVKEYQRETVGEGYAKFAEIRTGYLTENGKAMRSELKTVIADLESKGYHTFSNGRTISAYVWTKLVNKSNPLTYDAVATDPALTPGWRGVYDYTKIADVAGKVKGTDHNLAIEGLFTYIAPGSAEASALEAAGYKKTDWAIGMVREKDALWDYNMLSGIDLSDVPLYFHPLPYQTIAQSKNNVSNGYTLPQE